VSGWKRGGVGLVAAILTAVIYAVVDALVPEQSDDLLLTALEVAGFLCAPYLAGIVASSLAPSPLRARSRALIRAWGWASLLVAVIGALLQRAVRHLPMDQPAGLGAWGIGWLVSWIALLLGGPFVGAWIALGSGAQTESLQSRK